VQKVAVTGSAGFIGGYLVAELLRRGYAVVGIDDFSKYGPVRRPHDDDPHYELVSGDARDVGLLTRLLADCDHLIAAAALIGGIGYFHARPYDLLAANERLTAAACDAAIAAHRRGRLQKVTYISSSMVYECAQDWPSVEGQQLRIPPPRSAYGFSRLAVEYFARAAWDQYELPFTIVRPFNCVGVGEVAARGNGDVRLAMSHVVPDLVQKVLAGQDPLHVLGSGEQVRHYTYGGDVAAGIVLAMEHPAAANEDFNIAAAQGTSVAELARLIWRKVRGDDGQVRLEHDEPFRHDVQLRVPATAKARDLLGFEAATSLDEMLDEVIPWVAAAMASGAL
jgi:UDP-glucose 4-epimerase